MIIKPQFLLAALLLQSMAWGQQQPSFTSQHNVQRQIHAGADSPTVDQVTRQEAGKLNANAIKEFRITGPQFMRFENNPIVITDKQEMNRYIAALRHSYCRHLDFGNRVNNFEVIFLAYKGKKVPSLTLHFNLVHDLDSFGPEFRKIILALQTRVAQIDKSDQTAHKLRP